MLLRFPHLLILSAILAAMPAARARDFFVDPGDSDCGNGEVFCAIQPAIDAAFADGGADVHIVPGVYMENIVLRSNVALVGREEDGVSVVIEYVNDGAPEPILVRAEQETSIHKVVFHAPEGIGLPVQLVAVRDAEEVEVEECVFDGGFNRGSIGLLVSGQNIE